MITIDKLWASMPRDVQRKISVHDLKRITDNYNSKLPKETKGLPDPEDSWAQVELYRWQYGELPRNNEPDKELDESKALLAMANALEQGFKTSKQDNIPTVFNVCCVMKYVSKKLQAI